MQQVAEPIWAASERVSRVGVVLDSLGAVVIVLGTIASGGSSPVGYALAGVVLALALVLRRFQLLAAAALGVIGAVTQVVSQNVNVVADLAFAGLTYSFGRHRLPAYRRAGWVYAAVGVLGAGWFGAVHDAGDNAGTGGRLAAGLVLGGLAAVVLIGGWVAGYVRWQRRSVERARVEAALQARLALAEERRLRDLVAQEQDRIRIATDMHDVVAHSWAVVAAQADGARYLLHTDPDRAQAALGVIGETARTAMTDVRALLARLRDSGRIAETDEDLGFERTGALVARLRASGMTLEVNRSGTGPAGTAAAVVARRVLAESLTNALKHGDLDEPVRVDEMWAGDYRLVVRNAVLGPPAGAPGGPGGRPDEGHGVRGMAERVAQVGGDLTAGMEPDGRHWRVTVTLPGRDAAVDPQPGHDRRQTS